ncbi:hypothetical protein ABVV53_02340 [Novosphingobium sp. RD2P27]|uniref:Uncharacterized protein n=1 Tax=Novosphingobium kalidii TaxID=3230299 RepID=A0ABV2CXI3_9SPHN
MRRTTPSGAKLASGVLGGGVVAGLLLSLAVPTTMKRGGDGWRDLIPAAAAGVEDDSSTFWMEAPPQDLTPAAWQPTDSWEEPQWADEGWTPYADEPIYGDEPLFEADLTVPVTPLPAYEPVGARLARVAGHVAADAAAASAEAARMAAADVRMEIAAASQGEQDNTREPEDFETAFVVQ